MHRPWAAGTALDPLTRAGAHVSHTAAEEQSLAEMPTIHKQIDPSSCSSAVSELALGATE